MRIFWIFILFFAAPILVVAEEGSIQFKYFAEIQGKCIEANISGADKLNECHGLINVAFKNGRAAFILSIGSEKGNATALMLSGAHDEQKTRDLYVLEIDSISVNMKRVNAQGSCSMQGDPNKHAIYKCKVESLDKDSPYSVRYKFESSGAPKVTKS